MTLRWLWYLGEWSISIGIANYMNHIYKVTPVVVDLFLKMIMASFDLIDFQW